METILEIENLHVSFHTYAGVVKAVRGVNLSLKKGETLAIVGESGSGKTVTSKAIMNLLPNQVAKIDQGSIRFEGKDLIGLSEKEMENIRGSEISMIFQDPMTALNPTMTVGKQVIESIIKHQKLSKKQAYEAAENLFEVVGIPDAPFRIHQYPHQFSGGMRQRVMIAIALACNPKILIADEPTTALDVTIQAQILELLKDIQKKFGTSIILITHDLGVVANMADTVAVMYAGKVVETGTVDEIFYQPQHPYNWGLLSSMPDMNYKGELISIPGSPPDLMNPPTGDAFASRNEYAMQIDYEQQPPMFKVSDTHYAATWLLHPKAPKIEPPSIVREKLKEQVKTTATSSKVPMKEQVPLVKIQNLKKYFKVNEKDYLKAVNNISFDIYRGETLGIVGESGCGKSTTGRTIMRLYEATSGKVFYDGKPIHGKLSQKEESALKRKMQMIFQDPYASLDPRKTVEDTIAEGLDIHGLVENQATKKSESKRTVGNGWFEQRTRE